MGMEERSEFFAGLEFASFSSNRAACGCAKAHPRFYGVQYIHSGPVYLSVDGGREWLLKGPVAFLTSPEALFSYGSPTGTTRHQIHVCFEGERVRRYLATGLFCPASGQERPYTVIRSPECFQADMLELLLLLQQGRHDFAVSKLESILLSLQHQEQAERRGGYHQAALEQLAMQIVAQPEHDWDFGAEAAKLNLSLKHFMRLFRQCHGVPPKNFVVRQRLQRAREALEQELTPVKVIAAQCGFSDELYFSRLFKKYLLCSPSVYRNRHLGQRMN